MSLHIDRSERIYKVFIVILTLTLIVEWVYIAQMFGATSFLGAIPQQCASTQTQITILEGQFNNADNTIQAIQEKIGDQQTRIGEIRQSVNDIRVQIPRAVSPIIIRVIQEQFRNIKEQIIQDKNGLVAMRQALKNAQNNKQNVQIALNQSRIALQDCLNRQAVNNDEPVQPVAPVAPVIPTQTETPFFVEEEPQVNVPQTPLGEGINFRGKDSALVISEIGKNFIEITTNAGEGLEGCDSVGSCNISYRNTFLVVNNKIYKIGDINVQRGKQSRVLSNGPNFGPGTFQVQTNDSFRPTNTGIVAIYEKLATGDFKLIDQAPLIPVKQGESQTYILRKLLQSDNDKTNAWIPSAESPGRH